MAINTNLELHIGEIYYMKSVHRLCDVIKSNEENVVVEFIDNDDKREGMYLYGLSLINEFEPVSAMDIHKARLNGKISINFYKDFLEGRLHVSEPRILKSL